MFAYVVVSVWWTNCCGVAVANRLSYTLFLTDFSILLWEWLWVFSADVWLQCRAFIVFHLWNTITSFGLAWFSCKSWLPASCAVFGLVLNNCSVVLFINRRFAIYYRRLLFFSQLLWSIILLHLLSALCIVISPAFFIKLWVLGLGHLLIHCLNNSTLCYFIILLYDMKAFLIVYCLSHRYCETILRSCN